MDGTMAVITCFAGNFPPRNWTYCQGQILSIAQNQALFSLLGTTFGGNGQTTFALPDLRERTAVGTGQGPGLSNITLGQVSGNANITLTTSNLPPHNHNGNVMVSMVCDANPGNEVGPDGFYPAGFPLAYGTTATLNVNMRAPGCTATMQNAGGSQPLSIMQPYLAMNYVICLQGIYPSRN